MRVSGPVAGAVRDLTAAWTCGIAAGRLPRVIVLACQGAYGA
jgi:hypothetical protein